LGDHRFGDLDVDSGDAEVATVSAMTFATRSSRGAPGAAKVIRETPQRMRAIAVFAFISTAPGMMRVKAGSSNTQPARAAKPISAVVVAASRAGAERLPMLELECGIDASVQPSIGFSSRAEAVAALRYRYSAQTP
jgi:hypothetical protein